MYTTPFIDDGDDDIFKKEPLAWLPTWFYNKEVADFVRKDTSRPNVELVTAGCVVGPSIPWAYFATILLWSFFFIVPLATYSVTTCPMQYENPLPDYPRWLYAIFLPVLATFLFLEARCLYLSMAAIVQVGGRPKLFGFFKVPFVPWLSVSLLVSLINHLDIITNGLFLAKMQRLRSCPQIDMISHLWTKTIDESTLAMIPGVSSVSFPTLTLLCWSLMLLQLVLTLYAVFPIKPAAWNIDYKVGDAKGWGGALTLEYDSLFYKAPVRQNHASALFQLAEGARMLCISTLRLQFLRKKLQARLTVDRGAHSSVSIGYLQDIIILGLFRFVLVGFLENSLQLNIQVSTQAMNYHLTGKIDKQVILSIVMTILVSAEKVYEAVWLTCFAIWQVRGCRFVDDGSEEKLRKHLRKIWFMIGVLVSTILLFVLMLLYAGAKLVAIFYCRDSLWNINGCANLS